MRVKECVAFGRCTHDHKGRANPSIRTIDAEHNVIAAGLDLLIKTGSLSIEVPRSRVHARKFAGYIMIA
jgi:hypothetical protein